MSLRKETTGFQVLHGHMPQLDGPTNGIRGVGLGDRHLIMRVIDPASPEISFENQASLVSDK